MTSKKIKLKKSFGLNKMKWKKNLYENFGFPDNYTDITFLDELQKNVNVRTISRTTAILGAGLVTQEVCVVVLFVLLFVYLYNNWTEPAFVFLNSCILISFVYIFYTVIFIKRKINYNNLVKDLRTVSIFLVFGYVLSPILKTLTDTISTDTIFAMSTFMMAMHLIFFDYNVPAAIVSSSLSLNAAIFASVCLASRLASPFHAFALLTSAVMCFALLPKLLGEWRQSITALSVTIIVTLCILWTVSFTLTILFILVVLFITILCPLWFLQWQSHKDNIYGPWDEAIVQDTELN